MKKDTAIKLRKQGYSYNYINKKTNIPKSTLSNWLSKIPHTPNEYSLSKEKQARKQSGLVKTRQKNQSIEKAREMGKKDVGSLSKRDVFMLGIGLYIGEGAKTQNIIRIINADPKIIKFAVKWFKDICKLSENNLTLAIHLYPDNNIEHCVNYWSKITNIPINQFGKTQIDKRVGKKVSKRGHLPYGTAHLTVRSGGKKEFGVFLSRRIQTWMDEVLK